MTVELRAWHELNKEMVYPNVRNHITNPEILMRFDDENIMLKSSFIDNAGKPIYEGDIIIRSVTAPWDDEVPITIKQVVTFGDPFPDCFCLKSTFGDDNTCYLHDIGDANYVAHVTIVGNIYENPNLLK